MTPIELLKQGISSSSAEETISIASQFANFIPKDQVIALHGDLGAGKTTFVKGLARGWNINEEITSPTFNIYTIYHGTRNLVHLDAYRLSTEKDIENLLLEEFLFSPYCLIIEWPENIASVIPINSWHIYLSIEKDQSHLIKLS